MSQTSPYRQAETVNENRVGIVGMAVLILGFAALAFAMGVAIYLFSAYGLMP